MTQTDLAAPSRGGPVEPVHTGAASQPALDLWLVLRRQRWPLLLSALAGLVLGGLHAATSPDRYWTAATVLIDERASEAGLEAAAGFPVLRSETALLNEMQVLRSLQLAEAVVRDLGLHETASYRDRPVSLARDTVSSLAGAARSLIRSDEPGLAGPPPDPEALITGTAEKLRHEIGITRVGRSFSVEISMILHDADLATSIANSYARAYLADRQAANRAASDRGAAWVRENLEEVQRSADFAAADLANFRAENRALDPQGLREREQRVATLNELHAELLKRLETVTMEASYPITNGRLLSQAVLPREPALPKAWRLVSSGMVLGLMAGIGFAAWRELRETSVRSGEDVRRATGLAFLGYLPVFSKRRLRRLRPVVTRAPRADDHPIVPFLRPSKPRRPERPARPTRADRFVAPLYLPSISPDHAYNDKLKGILAKLMRGSGDKGCVTAVASLAAGEGRTTLAANLAQFAALSGLDTLLVDADLQSADLSRSLGFRREPGLAEVLAGRAAVAECTETLRLTGLDVLPYVPPVSPVGQAGILRLAVHLEAARRRYDFVVLDTPPLAASVDVGAVLGALDSVVMVADWGRTSRAALAECIAGDPELAGKTAGVVLNRTRFAHLGAYGVHLDPKALRRAQY